MTQDLSPFLKLWNRGVDIMVNVVSALLIAGVVGLFWFLRKEIELWYEHRRNAYGEARAIGRQLDALKLSMIDANEQSEILELISQLERLYLLHLETHSPEGKAVFQKWFVDQPIREALTGPEALANPSSRKIWCEFLMDVATVVPVTVYPPFPLRNLVRVFRRRSRRKTS